MSKYRFYAYTFFAMCLFMLILITQSSLNSIEEIKTQIYFQELTLKKLIGGCND